MVSYETKYMDPQNHVCYLTCLSSDIKPLLVGSGSLLLETDTKKLYYYDGDATSWAEVGTFAYIEGKLGSFILGRHILQAIV